jgi:hypothetical protein
MVRVDLARPLVCLLLGALSLTALSGCAAAATIPGAYPDVSLATTKSPAQLLRNEAAARLPAEVIDQIIESEDASVACLSESDDPEGLVRSWHSTVDVTILADADVATLVADLTASFEEQGWSVRDLGGNASVSQKLLESDGSLTDIQISGLTPDTGATSVSLEDVVEQPTVKIAVHGPCVRTGGTGSDEVIALEK